MKRLSIILFALFLSSLLAVGVFAATGKELLNGAEMYLTFEDNIVDQTGKHTLKFDGDEAFTEGKFGKAAQIVDAVDSIYTEDLKFGTNSFTITCWVKVNNHASDPCLFSNKNWESGSNPGFVLSLRDNDWRFNANSINGGTRTNTEYGYSLGLENEVGIWYHIALVVDRDVQEYCLFINGKPLAKPTSFADNGHDGNSWDDEENLYPFYIGEAGTGVYNLTHGPCEFDIDEFAVFFKALTEDEVVSVYTYAPEGYEAATLEAEDPILLPEVTVSGKDVLAMADVYLSFDDGISDANGHAVEAVGEVAMVDGMSGNAVKMSSSAGYIALAGYTFGTDSFTVTGWVNTEACSGDQCLFSNKDWSSGANPGWLITQKASNWKVNINAEGATRTDYEFGYFAIPDFNSVGDWYFLALVVDRDAGTYKLYINGRDYYKTGGEFTDDNGFDGLSFDSGLPFVIGQDGTGAYGSTLIATYDEIAIFKKALTAEEVAALYLLAAVEDGSTAPAGPADLLAKSFDTIYNGDEMLVDGGADGWLGSNEITGDISSIRVRGWAYLSTELSGFAYAVDGGEAVKSADFIFDRPDVQAAINPIANGFDITVDVSGLGDGDHTIAIYAVDAGGNLVDTGFAVPFTKGAGAAAAGYPASGESGNFLSGTVIGNATGWDSTEGSGACAAFDGNPASYFDPPSKGGDNWCGMQFDEPVVLEKVAILSRENWNARFNGATIDGSNDGENWTTLWQSSGEGTNPDYYVVTEFENNTGYTMFRYHNEVEHGDVAEIEFYGTEGTVTEAPAETPAETPVETPAEPEAPVSSPVDEELEAKAEAPNTFDFGVIAAVAAVISLAGFAAAKKKH